jgi:nitrate reductase gamma subunit
MRSEFKEMAKEIIFIQSMYHNNRPLWFFSFPFHFGLYMLVVFVLLIFLGAIFDLVGMPVAADGNILSRLLFFVTVPIGTIGSALAAFGAVGLLISRMAKRELRATSVRTDYFNLILLLGVFVSGLIVWGTEDISYSHARTFIADLISFQPTAPVSAGVTTHFVLAAAFMIYLPFTHMTHFVGKYFTYHKVRWEDSPNVKGSKLEERITEALGYTVSWSAPHIKTGGTWAEAATATEESAKDE